MAKKGNWIAAVFGIALATAPASGFAQGNGNGNGHGKGNAHKAQKVQVIKQEPQIKRNTVVVADCPPGLAKKTPACVPPGQAKKAARNGVIIGEILDLDDIHIITQPGLYGLGNPPHGDRYAIVDGRLVRVDGETGRLLSIIRLVDAILD